MLLFLCILKPFSYSKITDFLFPVKPENRCGFLQILKHVMGFCQRHIFLMPLVQVMGEGDDLDIVSTNKQFLCLLTFYAMLKGE